MPFQPAHRGRGRPRKVLPPKPVRRKHPPLAHRLRLWCGITRTSRQTALKQIERGELKTVKKGPATSPHMVRTTEYVRHGYIDTLDELVELEAQFLAENESKNEAGASDQEGNRLKSLCSSPPSPLNEEATS